MTINEIKRVEVVTLVEAGKITGSQAVLIIACLMGTISILTLPIVPSGWMVSAPMKD